jgi:RHS repeat-associated protein
VAGERPKLTIAAPAPSRRGGSIRGIEQTLAAGDPSGAATVRFELPLPTARGSRPALELAYGSGGGNGPFGIGFDVAVGSVARLTTRAAPRYTLEDTFTHSAYGELVHIPGGDRQAASGGDTYTVRSYRPRREGEFPRVEWWIGAGGSFWQSVDRDNVTSVFGAGASARVADPADPLRTFEWLLQETFDARGSHVLYEYKAEDAAGAPASVSELGRAVGAGRYLAAVRYGNAVPLAPSIVLTMSAAEIAALGWHLHVLFDYGEYDEAARVVGEWTARADPLSTYHAGFEVRTYRLCRSIFVLHQFEAELGPDPVLVRAVRLRYAESPHASTLIRIEEVGYRVDPANPSAPARVEALPPTELEWTGFDPGEGAWRPLDLGPRPLPRVLPEDELRFVDLDGVGIPGLLHVGPDGARFWEPVAVEPTGAAVTYAGPRDPEALPAGATEREYTLGDALGLGRPQWLETVPGRAAYAEIGAGGSSAPPQTFDAFPSEYGNPLGEQVDVTGTGLPDLVLVGATGVEWNPSLAAAGYAPEVPAPGSGLPAIKPEAPGEALRFADLLGSGQSHYARIRDGSVTCWPNLGFGRFGAPVELANAPCLADGFDPSRLFLADLDGSGPADLAYIYPGFVRVWRNASGNGFADPFDVELPGEADASARIEFADVFGIGATCLVVTQPSPVVRQWVYVFGAGAKPYLMTTVDDGGGQVATIEYTTSAQQYVADRLLGREWLTVPPSPVHVVAGVRREDALSETSDAQSFRYRHGYYDPVERTFAGFACVERTDAEAVADGTAAPPLLTCSWYHTGAAPGGESLEALLREEYFGGDPSAYLMPESSFALLGPGGEPTREALWSLVGRTLREEDYGLDGSALAGVPYRVSGHRYLATELQAGDGSPSVFFPRPLESIDFDYERAAADPRVRHGFTLEVDGYGNVLESCDVFYARRPGAGGPPAQSQALATLVTGAYLDVTEPFHLLGVPSDERARELTGLTVPGCGYLSLAELAGQLEALAAGGEGAPSATTTAWARYAYVPDTGSAPLAPQRLLASVAEAEHEAAALAAAFAPVLDTGELAAWLTDTGAEGCALAAGAGAGAGWWWNPGETLSYQGAEGFYRPRASTDAFGNVFASTDDAYSLFVASTVDPHGNTATGTVDYQALDYATVTDVNGGVAEFGYDPLGLVQVSTSHGEEGGVGTGFAPLSAWVAPAQQPPLPAILGDPAAYVQEAAHAFAYDLLAWTGRAAPADFEALGVDAAALWADLEARGYVTPEGAICRRFRRDSAAGEFALSTPFAAVAGRVEAILAAAPAGGPTAALLLSAEQLPGEGADAIVQRLAYYDGWLRVLQAKLRAAEGGGAASWLTGGAVRFDPKGHVVEEWEPFFSPTAVFDSDAEARREGVSSRFRYDARGRLVRTDTPLGTFRATFYGAAEPDGNELPTPWTVTACDENDTLLDSEYWAALREAKDPDPWELQAAERAALCYGTPARSDLDPRGRVIRRTLQNEAVVTAAALAPLGFDSAQAEELLAALASAGYLDPRGTLTPAFAGRTAGWTVSLPAPFDAKAAAITALLLGLQEEGTPLPTEIELDPRGNPARVADPRLGPAGAANFKTLWSLADQEVQTESADAGQRWRLRNARGDVVWERDANGTVTRTAYDALRRSLGERVERADGSALQASVAVYGDSPLPGEPSQPCFPEPERWNLRGQLVARLDSAGLGLTPFFSFLSGSLAQSRTLRADIAAVPDWSGVDGAAIGALCESLAGLSGPDQLGVVKLPAAIAALLEARPYVESCGYDGLGRVVRVVDADGNVVACSFDPRGLVEAVSLTPAPAGAQPIAVGPVEYDAHDRPASLTVPGSFQTTFSYQPLTFLLVGLRTVSLADPAPADPVLQDATYYHDPVGNVAFALDAAAQPWPAPAAPAAAYEYDLLYRLVSASGREAGEAGAPVAYRETYGYDAGGNLTAVAHAGASSWQQAFDVAATSNRLASGASYDADGNTLTGSGLAQVTWTDSSQLASLVTAPAADGSWIREYNAYDESGVRVRRVTQTFARAGDRQPAGVEEATYAGALEIVRSAEAGGAVSEWHATRLGGGILDLGRWLAWVEGGPGGAEARFPLRDVVGSVVGELDAHGSLLSAEEYAPYGAEALAWAASAEDAELQRRRYGAKERDAGVAYCFGARHYSPALRRWLSPDPSGPVDGLNLYEFVGGNPATFTDSDGRMRIHHWNVKDKTPVKLTQAAFVSQLAAMMTGARLRDNYGTVIVLTELMNSVTQAHFDLLLGKLNRKAGPGWSGEISFAGWSEGGTRREKIAILTYGVRVENYWQIVRDSPYATRSVMERRVPGGVFLKRHTKNSRFPFGVRIRTQLGGAEVGIDIGGYHNQGPGAGAATQAGEVIADARRLGVHALIGDFNTEPPAKRARYGPKTRATRDNEATVEGRVGTSKGGSLYDRIVITNGTINGRQLEVVNDIGARHSSSDHAQNTGTMRTKKRAREDDY